jgi:hypothetical protein
MIAAAFPASGLMHLVELLERNALVGPRGGTMNNDQIYSSHKLKANLADRSSALKTLIQMPLSLSK